MKFRFFYPAILTGLFFSSKALGQKETNVLRVANEAYRNQKFDEAVTNYEAVLKNDKANSTALFNLGNALFKSNKLNEAIEKYNSTAAGSQPKTNAKSLYNKGVSLIKQQKINEAIEAFKQALKANPTDEETRENLQKAINEKKQQQQQDNKDKKENKKEDKKNEQPDHNNKEKKQEQPPPTKNKLTPQQAEQKLQALRQDEKKLQEKLSQKQKTNAVQPEKDW